MVLSIRVVALSFGTPRSVVLHLLAVFHALSITALTAQPYLAEARALGTHIRVATLTEGLCDAFLGVHMHAWQ